MKLTLRDGYEQLGITSRLFESKLDTTDTTTNEKPPALYQSRPTDSVRGLGAWRTCVVCCFWFPATFALDIEMTKIDQVFMHLKKKPITSWEAIHLYHATRLADIVFKLKQRGHKIVTVMVTAENSCFARYYLIKDKK